MDTRHSLVIYTTLCPVAETLSWEDSLQVTLEFPSPELHLKKYLPLFNS